MSASDHPGLGGICLRSDWFLSEHGKLNLHHYPMHQVLNNEGDINVRYGFYLILKKSAIHSFFFLPPVYWYNCHIMFSSHNSANMLKQITGCRLNLLVLHTNIGVFHHVMWCHVLELYECTMCIWEQCAHSVSDIGDVEGEIAFLGSLLHFKALLRAYVMSVLRGLLPVCLGFWDIFFVL